MGASAKIEPDACWLQARERCQADAIPLTCGIAPRLPSCFVQHPAEIDEAVDLIERVAQSGYEGWIRLCHAHSRAFAARRRKPPDRGSVTRSRFASPRAYGLG